MITRQKRQRVTKLLPFRVYCGTIWFLCAAGLAVSVYLIVSHYRVHSDIAYRSFCAISKAINCDTVSQSPHSIFWSVPVPVWGALGFVGFFGLLIINALPTAQRQRGWAISLVATFAFALISVLLAAISAFWVGSYCIMCIAVYAICLLLLYFNWLLRRRFRLSPFKSDLIEDIRFLWSARRISLPIIGAVIVMGATVRFYLPHYWETRIPAISQAVRTGVTPDGHPWIGAEQPVLEIVEFTDYLCFQCRKMHHYLRELVERHPDKIRLVHRNYPMDHEVNFIFREPFHIGSGKLALLSLYAAEVGKFWEMNDLLYRISRNGNSISLGQISAELEIDVRQLAAALNDPILKRRLEIDVRYGLKLRILGTPTYMINAQIFEGFIPPEIIFPATNENSSLNSGTGSRTVSHSDT